MKTQELKGMFQEAVEDLKSINMDYLREHRVLSGTPQGSGYDVRRAEEERHRNDEYMGSDILD
ncbi:hypothetical protein [Geoalkalibacter halelectricus]|uniref:Uncharacterized protein n=1 Tax=Geoalkalibacter halelectricus TaxID=2847045 RepID=A0ABY5ZLG2_9BACT|nr:hypothetical protein [Geoalkalibacter halelectricus]MDO3378712.1 hypothetical protein [Geoalkalibacter halelectricus]UWZ79980.1 hypothetical protein L9S41_00940 [Geoalkalibacter halelectricus]